MQLIRYKEERRRQLAQQVASRLSRSSAASSSDEEEDKAADSRQISYAEYKRRRRQKENKNVTGSGQDLSLSSRRSKLSSHSLRSSESCLPRLRGSPEHIYQSIASDLGTSRAGPCAEKAPAKAENQDSGRSVSPPVRRWVSREGSVESSGEINQVHEPETGVQLYLDRPNIIKIWSSVLRGVKFSCSRPRV